MKKSSLLDSLEEKIVFIAAMVAICCTLLGFLFTRFHAAETAAFWTQLSFYAYGWGVCFGVACCCKNGAFMAIDVISGRYPENVKKTLTIVSRVVMLLIWAFLFVFSIRMVASGVGERNASAPALPVVIAYLAPVCGYFFAVVRSIQSLMGKEFKE